MSYERENIDTDLYGSREEAIAAAIDGADEDGGTLVICRGDWGSCPNGEICDYCARIPITRGLTPAEVLTRIQAS